MSAAFDSHDPGRVSLDLPGRHVAVAHSAAEGLPAAGEDRPVVVVCDVGLPGTDGLDLCPALRALPQLENTLADALTGLGWGPPTTGLRTAGLTPYR